MKRLQLVAALALLAWAAGCSTKYEDVRAWLQKSTRVMETVVSELENAQSPDAVVSAINKFCDSVGELMKEIEALENKYPDLKEAFEYWKDDYDASIRAGDKLTPGLIMQKLTRFRDDPYIRGAAMRLMKLGEKIMTISKKQRGTEGK